MMKERKLETLKQLRARALREATAKCLSLPKLALNDADLEATLNKCADSPEAQQIRAKAERLFEGYKAQRDAAAELAEKARRMRDLARAEAELEAASKALYAALWAVRNNAYLVKGFDRAELEEGFNSFESLFGRFKSSLANELRNLSYGLPYLPEEEEE